MCKRQVLILVEEEENPISEVGFIGIYSRVIGQKVNVIAECLDLNQGIKRKEK